MDLLENREFHVYELTFSLRIACSRGKTCQYGIFHKLKLFQFIEMAKSREILLLKV